jgi:hypothetical protein
MEDAIQILVVGGMAILSAGLLLGIPMAITRNQSPRAPRYLFAAHLAAIIQGGLLLALTIAFNFSTMASGVETTAALLLVAGMALFDGGLALNWIQGVDDAFAENSPGNKVSTGGVPLVLIGTAMAFYGVLASL